MNVKIKNAIISVYDKSKIIEFAKALDDDVNIYSTGGTAKALQDADIKVNELSDYTSFPEILGGRVKSLHPSVYGGILARSDNENDLKDMRDNKITSFDLVVVNLYPFKKVIEQKAKVDEAIENIDIGGVSLLRAAAKNYKYVCVVPDPKYYNLIIGELKAWNGISLETRKKLAMITFDQTASYDKLISRYFQKEIISGDCPKIPGYSGRKLRYGENPHQGAYFYINPNIKVSGIAGAKQLQGKALSFNNILDFESSFEMVKEFDGPTCAVIKHTNPCGVASAQSLSQAFLDAWEGDATSAFGSVIAFNKMVDGPTAREIISKGFIEGIIAPGYIMDEALDILGSKKNIRIMNTGTLSSDEKYDYDIKRIIGGILIQDRDLISYNTKEKELKCITERQPTDAEWQSLLFAWRVAKHVKSNAIVLTQGTKTVGIGAGQMSRVDAIKIAIDKAGKKTHQAVLASDGFFPKKDAVEFAINHGISAIIQPGGSIKDNDIIDLCNTHNIAMVFSGIRHFRH